MVRFANLFVFAVVFGAGYMFSGISQDVELQPAAIAAEPVVVLDAPATTEVVYEMVCDGQTCRRVPVRKAVAAVANVASNTLNRVADVITPSVVSYGCTGSVAYSQPVVTSTYSTVYESNSYGCTGSTAYATATPVRSFLRSQPVRSGLRRLFCR